MDMEEVSDPPAALEVKEAAETCCQTCGWVDSFPTSFTKDDGMATRCSVQNCATVDVQMVQQKSKA